jgi:aerotolerance regulator-like protein
MTVASPAWLWLLAALAVPLILHLSRRRSIRTVPLGSLRFLTGSEAAARRPSWHFSELVLMALRLATVGGLALGLAGVARQAPWRSSPVVLVDPAALRADAWSDDRVVDSLRGAGARFRLLAPGLPPLGEASAAVVAPPAIWPLIGEADRTWTVSSLVVIAPAEAGLAGGLRPVTRAPVRWYAPEWLPSGPRGGEVSRAQRRVAILTGDAVADRELGRYLAAAFQAIADLRGFSLELLASGQGQVPASADLVVLVAGQLQAPVPGRLLTRAGLDSLFGRPVTSAVLDPSFPARLEAFWLGDNPALRLQPVSAGQLAPRNDPILAGPSTPFSDGRYSAWLIFALACLVTERVLVAFRRAEATA